MSTTKQPATTDTYAAAYQRLNVLAQKLKTTTDVATIDDLVADVQSARAAAAICCERLEAIRREIDIEIAAAQAEPMAGTV